MISTGELRKGVVIELDGDLWQILDYHHIKMGRGSAQVRIKLRNVKKGQTVERSFQAGDRWPRAQLDRRPVQFLYRDGDDFNFMENETYDQFALRADQLDDAALYLKDGMTVDRTSYQGETIGIELPVTVDLAVRETEPGLRRRHADRRAQARHDRDRPRGPGADLRERGRHDPHRHPHGRVPDARLKRVRIDRAPIDRAEPPDWALPSWDTPDRRIAARARTTRSEAAAGLARPTPAASDSALRILSGQRRHARRQGRPEGRRSAARRLGRGRGRPGHGFERRPRLLHPPGRAQPARLRVLPRRPAGVALPAADRAARRRPRPDRPLRGAGRLPAVRHVAPAGGLRRPGAAVRGAEGAPRRRGAVRLGAKAAAAGSAAGRGRGHEPDGRGLARHPRT